MPWIEDDEYQRLLDIKDHAAVLIGAAISTTDPEQDRAYQELCAILLDDDVDDED
jgi:hypothetical protein